MEHHAFRLKEEYQRLLRLREIMKMKAILLEIENDN